MTPGVYIEEVSKFPPSVVPVETAIPAFIGYTQNTQHNGLNLVNRPVAVADQLEFEQIFGLPIPVGGFQVAIGPDGDVIGGISDPNAGDAARFRLAHAVRHFYDNGGGRCYIVSIGGYESSAVDSDIAAAYLSGLHALAREDEPTLIVLPDLGGMAPGDPTDQEQVSATSAQYHGVLTQALNQCAALGDRFLICDLWEGDEPGSAGIDDFRNRIGTSNLKYGAAYHPHLQTTLPWPWDEEEIVVSQSASRSDDGALTQPGIHDGANLAQLRTASPAIYGAVRGELNRYSVNLPPSAAVAGVYATVDRTRGVWKAPANVSLASVRSVRVAIDQDLNDLMNVHATGKSINALRFFAGKGFLVWGARTLAGNDNEWRYVPVRRLFNMVEESTKNASEPFVFEPNDANTWAKVKAMIENFLTTLWRQGALAGAKPEDAFYVRVGLGVTMTAQDVLEGRMNVEIGMAAVRPAEFIVLRFSHKMQES